MPLLPSPLPHSTVARNTTIPSPSFSHRPQRRPPFSLLFPSPSSPPPLPPCLPIKDMTLLHQRKTSTTSTTRATPLMTHYDSSRQNTVVVHLPTTYCDTSSSECRLRSLPSNALLAAATHPSKLQQITRLSPDPTLSSPSSSIQVLPRDHTDRFPLPLLRFLWPKIDLPKHFHQLSFLFYSITITISFSPTKRALRILQICMTCKWRVTPNFSFTILTELSYIPAITWL
ncbi:hypothetical protein TIFTF001_016278 [Ficus carica]|uniref:Uncharacterized protein n=1 Tax=Ficus carica TaxID=3494 RepID=A0AA88D9Q6_FICCA|nr:hypothetical protein TIFTF001_016278 [Ficus carica]